MYRYSKYIDPYINRIKQNQVEHCQEQEQMIDNIVIPVLKRDDVYIDEKKIEAGLDLQRYFPYSLIEWEVFLFALIAGVFFKSGKAFFTDIRIIVGRGSGKNGFISFLCFYLMSPAHGIRGYNIDLMANTEKQAKRSFEDVFRVITKPESPELAAALKSNYRAKMEVIECLPTQSTLEFNTSSLRGKDSKRTGCVIFDEKHEYMSTENINTLTSGLGKVPDGRIITITTDGRVRGGVLDKEKEQNRAILSKYKPSNRTLVFWCRIEKEEEWNQPDKLIKAMPSWNDFEPLRDTVLREIENMSETPDYYFEFMAKRCNFPIRDGRKAVAEFEDLDAASHGELIDLTGMDCVGGIDYSSTNDFTACVLLFKKGEKAYLLQHTFVCTRSRDLPGIKAPLDEWAKRGELEYVDDREIPARKVVAWFTEMRAKYNIKKIAIDKFRHSYLERELKMAGFDDGDKLYLLKRGDNARVYPLINSLLINQNIIWGGAPYSIMNWYTNNVEIVSNGTSFYFGKQEPNFRKTDGFMAWVAAMAIADDLETQETGILLDLPVIFV